MKGDELSKRLNKETGLVEGEDAAREVGKRIAHLAKIILAHPVIQMVIPDLALQEMVTNIVMLESTLLPMTQRESYMEMAITSGFDPREAGMVADMMSLSDTLPMTHPDVARLTEDRTRLMASMGMPESLLNEARLKQEQAGRQVREPEPHVELPEDIEKFLRQFVSEGEQPKGE